uniref:Uncharacterized protein n=1 Tax=Arundo donax TaxID=35708 RepID=A0A0A8ZLD3_ARUDO
MDHVVLGGVLHLHCQPASDPIERTPCCCWHSSSRRGRSSRTGQLSQGRRGQRDTAGGGDGEGGRGRWHEREVATGG